MKKTFRHIFKGHLTLTLPVDGSGDLRTDRKGMVDLGAQQYMSANKVAEHIIERDFRRTDENKSA